MAKHVFFCVYFAFPFQIRVLPGTRYMNSRFFYSTKHEQEWVTFCATAKISTSTTVVLYPSRMAKKLHTIAGLLQQPKAKKHFFFRFGRIYCRTPPAAVVDYFLLFAFPCLLSSSHVSVLTNNNPPVGNTSQSVECVTTHKMFFIGQQSVVIRIL